MATKKKPSGPTSDMYALSQMVYSCAPPALIVSSVRRLLEQEMDDDQQYGSTRGSEKTKRHSLKDGLELIWALATTVKKLAAENETLQSKLSRGNRKAAKPKTEMLKKTPETMPQPQDS